MKQTNDRPSIQKGVVDGNETIEYWWGAYNDLFEGIFRGPVKRKRIDIVIAMMGLILASLLILLLLLGAPLFILIFILILTIIIVPILIAYTLNITRFQVVEGNLFVSTRPIPIQSSKKIVGSEILSVGVIHTSSEGSKRVSQPYTSLIADLGGGKSLSLLKLQGYRNDFDKLAEELRSMLRLK